MSRGGGEARALAEPVPGVITVITWRFWFAE
jgi:hypothetical protein